MQVMFYFRMYQEININFRCLHVAFYFQIENYYPKNKSKPNQNRIKKEFNLAKLLKFHK